MATDKQFTTKTASLRATKIDTSKITLRGKNILDYIKDGKTIVQDIRGGNQMEYDVWPNGVQVLEDGTVTVYPMGYNTVSYQDLHETHSSFFKTRVHKIIDNVCYDENNEVIGYFDTKALTNGTWTTEPGQMLRTNSMFQKAVIAEFDSDLSNHVSSLMMFQNCSNLTKFNGDLSSSQNLSAFFVNCSALTQFNTTSLGKLKVSNTMFRGCTLFESFSYDMQNLTSGDSMFSGCSSLNYFSSKLPSLVNGERMFAATNITQFSIDTPKLVEAGWMFSGCENLTSFSANIQSLDVATDMFALCKLDANSVANIIQSISTRETAPQQPNADSGQYFGYIKLGLGIPATDEAKMQVAQVCGCDSWQELNQQFTDKNWVVQWEFNASTYNLRAPKPQVWVKLQQVTVTEGEELSDVNYDYTSLDGTKFFMLRWYHESNGNNKGYTLFNSIDEAIAHYEITPKN